MKISTIKTAVLVLGMVIISNVSYGQSQERQERQEKKQPPTFSQLIKEMDKDEDGKLSESEIKGPLKKDFSKVDANEDGYITEAEFLKAPKPKRKGRE